MPTNDLTLPELLDLERQLLGRNPPPVSNGLAIQLINSVWSIQEEAEHQGNIAQELDTAEQVCIRLRVGLASQRTNVRDAMDTWEQVRGV